MVDTVDKAIFAMSLDGSDYQQSMRDMAAAGESFIASAAQVTISTEKIEKATRNMSQSMESQLAKYDSVARFELQRKSALEALNRQLQEGRRTQAEYNVLLESQSRYFDQAITRARATQNALKGTSDGVKILGVQTGLATYQIANAGQQLQDIGVQLAGGQNPILIMVQQLPQLTFALGGMASALATVKALGAGALSFLERNPLILAAVATVTALGTAYSLLADRTDYAKKATEQYKDIQERIKSTLNEHKGSVLDLANAYARLTEEQKKSEQIDLQEVIRRREDQIKTLRSGIAEQAPTLRFSDFLPPSTMDGMTDSLLRIARRTDVNQALSSFKDNGQADAFKNRLADLGFTTNAAAIAPLEKQLADAIKDQEKDRSVLRIYQGKAKPGDYRIADDKDSTDTLNRLDRYRASWSESIAVKQRLREAEDDYATAVKKGLIPQEQANVELAKYRAEVEKSVKAKLEHTSALDKYIASLREEAAVTKLPAREQAIRKALFEGENAAMRDHTTLSAAQRTQITQLAAAHYDQAKAIEEVKKQQEELDKVSERVTDNITDRLLNGLEQGKSAWVALKEVALRELREIAANAVIKPILKPTVSALLTGSGVFSSGSALAARAGTILPGGVGVSSAGASNAVSTASGISGIFSNLSNGIGSAFNAFSSGIGSLGFGGFSIDGIGTALGFGQSASFVGPSIAGAGSLTAASLGSILGAGGLGFMGGGLLAGLTGGNQLGGSIGGGVGALAGMAIGGPIGGLIGGIGGSLLGGLFGPKKSVGPNANTNLNIRDGRLFVGETGADNGGDRSGTIQLANQAVSAINALIDKYGIRANDPSGGRLGYTGLPHAMGFEVYTGAANAGKPQTPDEVLAFMRRNGLLAGNGLYGTVLANSKATTVDSLSADLDVAKFIEDAKKAATALSSLAQQFVDLGKQADDYAKKAAQLGIASTQVYNALAGQFNRQTSDAIQQLLDPEGFALKQFEEQANARLDYAKKIGADLVAVEKLTGLQRQELLKQYSQQGINDLKAWLDQQKFGATSSLSPVEKMRAAQQQYDSLLSTARAGGGTAGLTGAADTLLAASKDVMGGATQSYTLREMLVRLQLQNLLNSSTASSAASTVAAQTSSTSIPSWQLPVLYGQSQQTQVLTTSLNNIADQIATLSAAINQQNQTAMVS